MTVTLDVAVYVLSAVIVGVGAWIMRTLEAHGRTLARIDEQLADLPQLRQTVQDHTVQLAVLSKGR